MVAELKDWIDTMYADNRTTSMSNKELMDKIEELKGK
jgi:hypothetical protein